MSWLKPKRVENYTGMESEQPFGDEMPNFDICGPVFKELFKDIDVLDINAKTETAASSENSGRKSTENEQLEVYHSYWGFPMMQELHDDCESQIFNKYCWTWSEIFVQSFECGGNWFAYVIQFQNYNQLQAAKVRRHEILTARA